MPIPGLDAAKSTCNGIMDQANSMTGMLDSALSAAKGPLGDLDKLLKKDLPLGDIGDVVNAIGSAADPILADIDTASDILGSCTGLDAFGDAAALAGAALDGAMDLANKALGALDGLSPDLSSLTGAFSGLDDLINSVDLGSLIPSLDGVLNCLSSVCAVDMSALEGVSPSEFIDSIDDKISGMTDTLDKMGVDDNGVLSMDKLMDKAGVTGAKRDVAQVTDAAKGYKDKVTDAASEAKASIASESATTIAGVKSALKLRG